MKIFKTIKQNHIAALESLETDRFDRKVLGLVALVSIVTIAVVAWLFGPFIQENIILLLQTSDIDMDASEFYPWVYPLVFVFDVFGEIIWSLIVAWVALRIVKRMKRMLPYKQLFNTFLMIRLYEGIIYLALLFGFGIVVMFGNIDIATLLAEDNSGGDVFGLIVTVIVFWVYYWSIKYFLATTKETPRD